MRGLPSGLGVEPLHRTGGGWLPFWVPVGVAQANQDPVNVGWDGFGRLGMSRHAFVKQAPVFFPGKVCLEFVYPRHSVFCHGCVFIQPQDELAVPGWRQFQRHPVPMLGDELPEIWRELPGWPGIYPPIVPQPEGDTGCLEHGHGGTG